MRLCIAVTGIVDNKSYHHTRMKNDYSGEKIYPVRRIDRNIEGIKSGDVENLR